MQLKTFFYLFIILSISQTFVSFNLSPQPNLLIKQPKLETFKPRNRSTYFGFSLVLRHKSIIIGAPRAQTTLLTQRDIDESGDIYKCPFNLKQKTSSVFGNAIACKPFVFEKNGNILDNFRQSRNEFRDYQWLGAAMDGSGNDSEPILACAPRFDGGQRFYDDRVGYMHGICYRSANTLEDNAVGVWRFKPFVREGLQIIRDIYYYQLAELGISAHITPNNEEYIIGAPGFNNWQGTAVRFRNDKFDIPNGFSSRALLLNGYAVGSGYLDSLFPKRLTYVTTAPHENMYHGKAFVYRYTRDGIDIKTAFTGYQFGEFYGYALLVSDITGDGLDDILITAPQHRVNGESDIGAVYVYINKGNFQFMQQIIEAPFTTTARFGAAISTLDDINHDGFNDIAIGAPLYEGTGAVIIYHGSAQGLQIEPKQILRLPEHFNAKDSYFGHALSKGIDIDGNGYADLAIGAPNAEQVYIYRSYPVIKVTTTLAALQSAIKPEMSFIDFQVCFHHDNELPTPLLLELSADNILRRLKFRENNLHQVDAKVLATNFKRCTNFSVEVTFVAHQMFTPLEMELTYSLVNNGSQQFEKTFCNDCVVVDPSISRSQLTFVKYNPGCKTDICKVDLSIEAREMPSKITIGENKTLKVAYNIQNRGEKAFNTQVIVQSSLNLSLTRLPANCFEMKENELICDIAKGINALEKLATLEIEYDLSKINDINELIIKAEITSTGHEIDNKNNRLSNKIQFQRNALLDIVGRPLETLLSFGDYEKTLVADFVYQLENHGPSSIKNLTLALQMPVAYLDQQNQTKNFINASEIKYLAYFDSQEISGANFEISTYQLTKDVVSLNKTWQTFDALGLNPNRIGLQNCQLSNQTICAVSFFQIDALENLEKLRLQLRVEFSASTLIDYLKSSQKNILGFFVALDAKLNSPLNSSLRVEKLIQPLAIQYRAAPDRPIWIYLLAIIGGILLLGLLTFLLYKLGFFKRSKKEEMQKLIENNEVSTATLTETSETT